MIMKTSEKTSEVLNELIQINNDRVEGYEKAAREAGKYNQDLKSIFKDMAAESREYGSELGKYVSMFGEEPADGTTTRGKIYRTWMDIKTGFSNNDRKSILSACEYGEDAAQKAYEDALRTNAELPVAIRQLIVDQKSSLKKSHDRIKKLRDSQAA